MRSGTVCLPDVHVVSDSKMGLSLFCTYISSYFNVLGDDPPPPLGRLNGIPAPGYYKQCWGLAPSEYPQRVGGGGESQGQCSGRMKSVCILDRPGSKRS